MKQQVNKDRQQQVMKGTRSIWNEKYRSFGVFKWFTQNIIISLSAVAASSVLALACGFIGLNLIYTVPLIASTMFVVLVMLDKVLISQTVKSAYKAAKVKYPELSINDVMMICQDLV